MSKLEEVEKLITNLNPSERGELLQHLLRMQGNIGFGIETNPKINGGEPCIVRTRIPVWLIIRARQLGTSDGDILKNFPTLRAEDEIDKQIQENEAA
jgi:uncharacterized protein (DUF433 family)